MISWEPALRVEAKRTWLPTARMRIVIEGWYNVMIAVIPSLGHVREGVGQGL
jgi:hypothetical protein